MTIALTDRASNGYVSYLRSAALEPDFWDIFVNSSYGIYAFVFGCALRYVSHAGTVVPECFKDDSESQWESGKFDPRGVAKTSEPIVTKIVIGVIRPYVEVLRTSTRVQNFIPIQLGGFAYVKRTPLLRSEFWQLSTATPAPMLTLSTSSDAVLT